MNFTKKELELLAYVLREKMVDLEDSMDEEASEKDEGVKKGWALVKKLKEEAKKAE